MKNKQGKSGALAGYEPGEFQRLLDEISEGSEEAVGRLIRDFGPHIIRSVRRHLNPVVRSQFDSQDFMQSVWASFLLDPDRISEIRTPKQFVAFMSSVAKHKVINECLRRLRSKKYGVSGNVSIDQDPNSLNRLFSQDPSPSQVATADDELDHLVRGKPSYYREVIELRLKGETLEGISAKASISERTVRRVLQRLERKLDK